MRKQLAGCFRRLIHYNHQGTLYGATLLSNSKHLRHVDTTHARTKRTQQATDGHNKALRDAAYQGVKQQFKQIGEAYSSAKSVQVTWNTDINLGPSDGWKGQPPPEDKYTRDYYNSLQYTLFETGFPETVDRTAAPRSDVNPNHVTIAVLASPFECIGTLLEGGRQLPDGLHLILSPTWLSVKQSVVKPGTNSLFVHKAITFGKNGTSFLDEFKSPRPVTYFLNLLTENVTGGQRSDGEQLEENIDCPISGSLPLVELVDNKLWTRKIMSEVGMSVPETLGFIYKPKWRKEITGNDVMTIHHVTDDVSNNKSVVEESVPTFLERIRSKGIKRVVVKPSGPRCYGSIGVSYHSTDDSMGVAESVLALMAEMEPGDATLVESFEELQVTNANLKDAIPWSADNSLSFRIKATVCRRFDDTPVTTMITCVAGQKDRPINGDNGVPQTLDSMLLQFGVTDALERKRLEDRISRQSEAVCRRIMETEKDQFEEGKLMSGAQTDVIGIDVIISRRNGGLTPVGIEVNSHDCTINCQIAGFMASLKQRLVPPHSVQLRHAGNEKIDASENDTPENDQRNFVTHKRSELTETTIIEKQGADNCFKLTNTPHSKYDQSNACRSSSGDRRWESEGASVRPWVENMICRSQKHLMRGKRVVVIGGGGYSKRKIWEDAKAYGIEVILVESNKNHLARDIVSHFIHYDCDDHALDVAHAWNITNFLEIQGIKADGCVTFWEDCVPLAALVCQNTGLNGSSFTAALNAKKKSRTQSVLGTRRDDIPHWPRTYLYSSNVQTLNSGGQHPAGKQGIKFPAVLKLEHGSSAVGVSLVRNEHELLRKSKELTGTLKTEADFHGVGLGYDNSLIAMDYHEGSEHDVDIVIFGSQPVAAFISDNGPTRIPRFTETAAVMPSTLPDDKQAQLVTAAYQCCTDLGLSDGVYNVELKMTPTGPKLIEINARMGGFYLRDWIQKLYGVDLMLHSCMVACGIKPYIPKKMADQCIMGVMLLPSLHSHILNDPVTIDKMAALQTAGDVIWTQFANEIGGFNEEFEEPFGNIAVMSASFDEAKAKLMKVCRDLGVDGQDYDVSHFTKQF